MSPVSGATMSVAANHASSKDQPTASDVSSDINNFHAGTHDLADAKVSGNGWLARCGGLLSAWYLPNAGSQA